MNKSAEKILQEALTMSAQDRAFIAERLITSLDTVMDTDVEIAWQQEIQKRLSEVESGEVTCLPWEEVRKRLPGQSRANH